MANISEIVFLYTGQPSSAIPKNITHVRVNYNVKAIDEGAFMDFNRIVDVELYERVGLESIGNRAFQNCILLKSIDIPSSVKTIGSNAFLNCRTLRNVQLNEGLSRIAFEAFKDCSLFRLILPSTVKVIESRAFFNCRCLDVVHFNDQLEAIGDGAFQGCSYIERIATPSSLKVIRRATFCNCSRLVYVQLNEGLTTIERWAFQDCTSLRSIIMPSTVKQIELKAFHSCFDLVNVQLNEGLKVIGKEAFDYCRSLQHIRVPSTVDVIGHNAFKSCRIVTYCQEIEQLVSETSLQEWWNRGTSDCTLRTYCFLSKNRIAERIRLLPSMKLRLAIDDMLGHIRFFNDRGFDAYVRSIDSKLTFFEKLKDAIPLLELAIWKAKLVEQSYPSNEDSTIDSKLQHRVSCGADVIIPNVLSFLIG